MALFRTAALLGRRSPDAFISHPSLSQRRHVFSSILRKTQSDPPGQRLVSSEENREPETPTKMKRLVVFFKEAVGLSPRTEESIDDKESGSSDLGRELKQLETKLWSSNKEQDSPKVDTVVAAKKEVEEREKEKEREKHTKPVARRLSDVFRSRTIRRVVSDRLPESSVTIEKLSPEMKMFLNHLHSEGYFNGASFLTNGKLESGWYKHSCGRDFIKSAADKFGKDHQEIAKMLSGSELKKVALFGCPSVARKTTSAAKKLRVFFSIAEQTVCSKCALRSSCKFVNQQFGGRVAKIAKNELSLLAVLRVITSYALELVPPNLSVPDDLKSSTNRLLRDIVKLSRTTMTVKLKT
ncbi:uncharacterized protein LOC116211102 [Punica granatum]|nr:uncharacterized protein LOC116211102 [Punica granatum]